VRHPDDILDRFEIGLADGGMPEADSAEAPPLAAAPGQREPDGVTRLDPARAVAAVPAAASRRRRVPFGIIGSLALHLLPLLLLMHWRPKPQEVPPPIAVQLVVVQPPPAPAEKKAAEPREKKPPPGRLASVEMGEKAPKSGQAIDQPEKPPEQMPPEPKPPEPNPPEPKTAALAPPPAPAPPEPEIPAPPPAAPKGKAALVLPPPEKPPAPRPHPVLRVLRSDFPLPLRPDQPKRRPRSVERVALAHAGEVPGPDARRDQYLAYLVSLTRRRFYMLPPSLIAGRSGVTELTIRVMGDGTIEGITVVSGSGYPDIDSGIQRMVASIRQFPPLPQWYPGDSVDLNMRLRFPEALEQ
jgi:TonB family protein